MVRRSVERQLLAWLHLAAAAAVTAWYAQEEATVTGTKKAPAVRSFRPSVRPASYPLAPTQREQLGRDAKPDFGGGRGEKKPFLQAAELAPINRRAR